MDLKYHTKNFKSPQTFVKFLLGFVKKIESPNYFSVVNHQCAYPSKKAEAEIEKQWMLAKKIGYKSIFGRNHTSQWDNFLFHFDETKRTQVVFDCYEKELYFGDNLDCGNFKQSWFLQGGDASISIFSEIESEIPSSFWSRLFLAWDVANHPQVQSIFNNAPSVENLTNEEINRWRKNNREKIKASSVYWNKHQKAICEIVKEIATPNWQTNFDFFWEGIKKDLQENASFPKSLRKTMEKNFETTWDINDFGKKVVVELFHYDPAGINSLSMYSELLTSMGQKVKI